jgi:putative MATE family efflux protein
MHGKDLTTGSVARNLIAFSIPMLMGSLAHTTYSIINVAWVGNGLGTDAMAAITVSFPILFLLMAVAGGLTMATNTLVAQAYGAKDEVRIRQVIQSSLSLTVLFGTLCLIAGQAGAEYAVRAMGTPPEVAPLAAGYLRLFVWTTPFMFGMFLLASTMRGIGDSKTPLYFQVGSLLVTIALDPILMFGWLGFPRFGLNGTALATVVTQAGAFVALAVYLHRKKHTASPDWSHWRIDVGTLLLVLRIGVPSMLQQAIVALGTLGVVRLVNHFGAESAAAYGIAMRIDQLAFMPAMAISGACCSVAGQNIGAGLFDRVRGVLQWGWIIALSFTLPAFLLCTSIPSFLMALFAHHDEVVIHTGAHYLRIASPGYLMVAIMFVCNGVINGSGHTLPTTLFTAVTFFVVRVPLAMFLPQWFGSVDGIWYAILFSYVAGMTLSLLYYSTGRWKRPVFIRNRYPLRAPVETLAQEETGG